MRKLLTLAVVTLIAISVQAKSEKKDSVNPNAPVFTTVKENKITSIKDQNKSGTCWCYSTLAFLESEILKKTGKEYDLGEMFVVNKTYMDRAKAAVRMHGDISYAEGGSAYDPIYCAINYGLCPETAMPLPGTLYGDTLANFGELTKVTTAYVDAIAKSDLKKLSPVWQSGFQSILDNYLGKCPEKFTYMGKQYTPQSFASSLGLNWNDYVSITSYTHHPFWKPFIVEVQDNWRWAESYNVPIEDMIRIIDNAINDGYTVAWGSDVSEDGFTRSGLGIMLDEKKTREMSGTDADHWFKLDRKNKTEKIDSLGVNAPEVNVTQDMRQKAYDNWETTDDHGMQIYGIAKDQNGKEYYMVKNSWGKYGKYKGIWYVTKTFAAYKTMDFMVNKNAIPKDIRKKLGI
jgi:aminopeptidase C